VTDEEFIWAISSFERRELLLNFETGRLLEITPEPRIEISIVAGGVEVFNFDLVLYD
jgi:hypothetical protein